MVHVVIIFLFSKQSSCQAHYGNVVQHFKWDTDYGEFVVTSNNTCNDTCKKSRHKQ